MNYPGWDEDQEFEQEHSYNRDNWTRLQTVRQILAYVFPQGEEEVKLLADIKDATDKYCLLLDAKSEIFGGCYGADIWSENPITKKQKQVLTEISWIMVEDEIRELHRKDPSMLYWVRPHDPRKKTGIVAWLRSIFKHKRLDSS